MNIDGRDVPPHGFNRGTATPGVVVETCATCGKGPRHVVHGKAK